MRGYDRFCQTLGTKTNLPQKCLIYCATLTIVRRNYLQCFCLTILLFYKQASLDGLTGPIHFSEDGARTKIELDILNLRNDSFKKVSHTKHHKIICYCVLQQTFLSHQVSFFFNQVVNSQPGTVPKDNTLKEKKLLDVYFSF